MRHSLKKLAVSVTWSAFVFAYYTGFLLLMEKGIVESVRFGIAVGLAVGVIVFLLYDWEPPRKERWGNKSHGNSYFWR